MMCFAAGGLSPVTETLSQGTFSGSPAGPPGPGKFVNLNFYAILHLQLLLQELSSFRTVAAVAVHMDGAGGGGIVDQQDRRHHVLVRARTLHRACDCMVRDEMLHVLLQQCRLEFLVKMSPCCKNVIKNKNCKLFEN